jgi:hypothetical protein
MGHYDDIIEAREAAEFKARADKLGMTTEELYAYDEHNRKFREGEKLFREQEQKQAFIDYYLKHRSVPET